MYLIDKGSNRINEIQRITFIELRFRERDHLQVGANEPTAFGE